MAKLPVRFMISSYRVWDVSGATRKPNDLDAGFARIETEAENTRRIAPESFTPA